MSDITAWTFVILALGAWSVRGWVAAYGQERIVSIFGLVFIDRGNHTGRYRLAAI